MTTDQHAAPGPHAAIPVADARERFAARLFDVLWDRYRGRVEYVARYEEMIRRHGATFVNDHIAFRTIASQEPLTGIVTLSRIVTALGYAAAGVYDFPDKALSAIHFQHANPQFPKLFISELRLWELPDPVREIVEQTLATHREPLPMDALVRLHALAGEPVDTPIDMLLERVVAEFHELPWDSPSPQAVEAVNRESQYAAWVMVHGYNVNHFTSLINSHGVTELDDIEKTSAALAACGVPMKSEIEGSPGSKLRQTATQAVVIDVPVRDGGEAAHMPWTYAYFELAERGDVTDPETGERHRFEGFLGPQATQLFEMTRKG
jgi:hypothetical protein